ncbi:MAG: bifunctional metallophosphatase/5'-nucleotidase [Clostridia bacterium]|nr:bifunctional metallophosphatase/5'-nucleotidase [Clostridia bacterium]
MKRYRILSIVLAAILAVVLLADLGGKKDEDIIILFTNDVHCGVDENIGYAGLAAYKEYCLGLTPYVTLVDCGDAIQGDLIGAVSDGEYIVDIMNEVGYDIAILGNHEFDFGMEQLKMLISRSNATYLAANVTYHGSGENVLADTKPYKIISYGDTDVAFIGLSTPYTITSSTPTYFMEDGEFVYSFANGDGSELYTLVQGYIDDCRAKGADYVILLTHLGDTEAYSPYSSVDLIRNTVGVDALLDAHEHSVIPCEIHKNKAGQKVLLASTGTKLNNIGRLTITPSGNITVGLVSDLPDRDADTVAFIEGIKASYEEELNTVIAQSSLLLTGYTSDGVRLVRSRETNIGNLCADAYRAVAGADIGLVNGGGVRADIAAGGVTYADMIAVHPFGNTLCMVEATGREIVDALEVSVCEVQSEYAADGAAVGENGSFLQVSGIRFTIDTSVESSVVFDENFMLASIGENRRVKDVEVLGDDGEYHPIELERTYTVASHNYLLADSGCGHSIFSDNVFLIDRAMSDYEVLITYVADILGGNIGEEYAAAQGRITVK